MITPWGKADSQRVFADGVTFYTTPSHGGFHLSPQRVREIPVALRGLSGYSATWYEEDCAYAAVVYALPHIFVGTGYGMFADAESAKQHGREVLQRWYPDELAKAEA